MLFLFRNIRRKLMRENKISTYLLYAIGEIILVVVGILIAVNIDDRSKGKERQQKEIQILRGIQADIKRDTLELLDLAWNYNRLAESLEKTLEQLLADSIQPNRQTGNTINRAASNYFSISLHRAYFDEAKTAGLSIITNPALRDSISLLYEFHYSYLLQAINETHFPQTQQRLYEAVDSYYFYHPDDYEYIPSDMHARFKTDQHVLKNVSSFISISKILTGWLQNSHKKGIRISEMIDKEIATLENY